MSQTQIDSFIEECQVPVVAGHHREQLLADTGVRILFITGDVDQRPEVGDLTVVLREILRDYTGRVHIALADRSEETLFRGQFEIKVFPTMVVFRDGQPVGLIPGMKRWEEYIELVKKLLGEATDSPLEVDPLQEIMVEMKRFTGF